MAINYPGPYQMRFFYTAGTRQHRMNLNLDLDAEPTPGTQFSSISAIQRGGGSTALHTLANSWVTILRPFFNATSVTIINAELWKYEPASYDASFISSHPINLEGTSGTTTNTAGELIFTFRTIEGGIMRIHLMDSVIPSGASQDYADLSTSAANLVDTVIDSTNCWLAKDTSYPFSFLRMHPGVNEKLFKEVFR